MNSSQVLIGLAFVFVFTGYVYGDERPNIVHIIADDLGWNDVGFHGSEIKTPAIDKLANESVILNRFYVTPICSPTRAGALTGKYPFRFGIWGGVVSPTQRHGLPPSELTTPEHLENAGYKNRAIFGKWHLGLASTKFHPLNHGFTEFYGHYNGAIDYFSRKRFGQLDWHRNYKSVYEEGYSTDLIGDAAAEFIDRQTSEHPFYLLVTFNAPHSPLQAKLKDLDAYEFDPSKELAPNTDRRIAKREKSPEYGERGKGNTVRQTFSAMTSAMDRNIKKILNGLDQKGFRDNTLVIFHSDNGADPKHGGSNLPLRGSKFSTWEGGVRVVAMMRWPEKLKPGTKCSILTSYIDLLPTQLAAAGLKVPQGLDGINLLPSLELESQSPDRTLILGEDSVVSNRWKLHNGELYDLVVDPNESKNIASEHPDQVERLTKFLGQFSNLQGSKTTTALPKPSRWPPQEWVLPEEPEIEK